MWKKIKKSSISTLLVSGSTGIFALISLISVLITINSWQIQREAARPYFTFKESPTIQLNQEVSFEFKFQNVGTHPATDLTSKTLVFHESLAENPILSDTYNIVNDIPRDTATTLVLHIDPHYISPETVNLDPHYIVIYLTYKDPILNEVFNQVIYIKWPGIQQGKALPLIHMDGKEKKRVLEYISNHQYISQPLE